MNDERPPSLLEHFTRQFAEQASRGGHCAGPLAEASYAGQQVRRLQHELAHVQSRAAHAEERARRAEQRVQDAQAEVSHWNELATRDFVEEGNIDLYFWENDVLPGATRHLAEYEAAYQVCRAGAGGHERGACRAESAMVAQWRSIVAGYTSAIKEMTKQKRAIHRRWQREERAQAAAEKVLAAAQENAARAGADSDQLAQEAAQLTRVLLAAREALAQALAALRRCRQEHPADDCGEYGGPGVRLYGRDKKKCASWKDVLGTAE